MISANNVFRLKHFKVSHGNSTMKVGTDAFILGSLLKIDPDYSRILDVGTGCGIIALMLAQRSGAQFDAIDIDQPSLEEAKLNFEKSPWSNRLHAIQVSIHDFKPKQHYDLIVSNPPFFSNSLLPVSEKLRMAKHTTNFDPEDFVKKSKNLLKPHDELAVILPADVSTVFSEMAVAQGFYMAAQLQIIPKEGKPANRKVLIFSLVENAGNFEESLVIRDLNGNYTPAYKKLTADYHAEGYL